MSTPVAVLTIGMFDGVHRGHRAVLARARARAAAAGAETVALTFEIHPRLLLNGRGPAPRLSLNGEKAELLRAEGADRVRVLAFTPGLAELSPREFLARHVFPWHRAAGLVVGYDFAMGKGRVGSAEVLARLGEGLGFFVERVGPELDKERPISSSRVRDALLAGDVEEGARLLGRPYALTGTVGSGDGRGRTLGFPTANLRVPGEKIRPARGVYAVRVHGASPGSRDGVLNIGGRPTFGGGEETVEAHLLDFEGDLAGRPLRVEFVARIRDERKFSGPAELADQIGRDVERGRALLGSSATPRPGGGSPS